MSAKVIDGIAVAAKIRQQCRVRCETGRALTGTPPGLAVIIVGDDPASKVYVRNKMKACAEVGIRSWRHEFQTSVDPEVVIEKLEALNADPEVHGILVQPPLPPQFDIRSTISNDTDFAHCRLLTGCCTGPRPTELQCSTIKS